MRRASLTQCLCILLAILGLVDVTGATAQETPPAEPATAPNRATVSEVDRSSSADELSIPLAELKLLLRPLTVEELEKEAEAWHELVKSKAVEISTVEIAALRKEDVGIEKKLADLLQEEADLVNRFLVVLDSLQKKGGDVETYRRYLAAITDAALETVEVKQLWAFIVNWLRSPEGGLQIGKRLGMFILTLLVAYLVAQIVGMIVKRATSASYWEQTGGSLRDRRVMMIDQGHHRRLPYRVDPPRRGARYVARVAELCQNSGVQLILVEVPIYRERTLGGNYRTYLENLGVSVVSIKDRGSLFVRSNWFNRRHMNIHGSELFSDWFAEELDRHAIEFLQSDWNQRWK